MSQVGNSHLLCGKSSFNILYPEHEFVAFLFKKADVHFRGPFLVFLIFFSRSWIFCLFLFTSSSRFCCSYTLIGCLCTSTDSWLTAFIKACVVLPSFSRGALARCREHLPPSLFPFLFQHLPAGHISHLGLEGCIFFKPFPFFPICLCCRAMTCCRWPSEGPCDAPLAFSVERGLCTFLVSLLWRSDASSLHLDGKEAASFEPLWAVFCLGMVFVTMGLIRLRIFSSWDSTTF